MKRKLDDWIEAYMKYVDHSEPPYLYKKWTAMSTIAAVLQRKCYHYWEAPTYPNLYVVLVGPSGRARKGTAMKPGQRLLRKLQIKMSAEAITREALIRELKKSASTQMDPETNTMLYHASLTIYSKELTVFLGYNNIKLMSDLTDWYDCDPQWTYRTKGMGTDEIQGVWVNLIGATTPELIQSSLPQDAVGGGLTSRMIFVYEQKKGKRVVYPWKVQEEDKLWDDLVHDLEIINDLAGEFIFDDSFIDYWGEWYPHQDDNPPFEDKRFDGYNSRRATHVRKLAMIMCASRTNDKVITEFDLKRAIELLHQTEKKMPLTFSGMGLADRAEVTNMLMSYIARKKEVDKRVLLSHFLEDVGDLHTLEIVLETLKAIGWCDTIHSGRGNTTIIYTPDRADEYRQRAYKEEEGASE